MGVNRRIPIPVPVRVLTRVGVLAVLAVLLAGCGGDDAGAGGAMDLRDELVGSWTLVSGVGPDGAFSLVGTHPVTLVVEADGDNVGGTAACNAYGGRLEVVGERVSVTEVFATEMACSPPEVMDLEQAYLAALTVVDTARPGDRLELTGGGVELVFERSSGVEDAPLGGPAAAQSAGEQLTPSRDGLGRRVE